MPIEFSCPSCKTRYSVKDELAGKGAKCGKCGHRMKIPVLAPPEPEPEPAAAESAGLGSWLDDELQPEPPTDVAPEMMPSACPSCGASLAAGTALCAVCGYDTRTGAKRST